jgi:hypothetical protein
MCSQRNVISDTVRQHSRVIIYGNTRLHVSTINLVICGPILTIVLPDAMHTLGSQSVNSIW